MVVGDRFASPGARNLSMARKAHKHKLFWSGWSWDDPENAPATNRACLWDKPTLSQGQTQVFPGTFYTVEAQFVPGTNPICPWDDPGDEGRQKKFVCQQFMCLFAHYFRFQASTHVSGQLLIPERLSRL